MLSDAVLYGLFVQYDEVRRVRLRKSRQIALTAVTAAVAFLCVLIGRFTPVGGFFLLAVAGTMTMLAVKTCGAMFGALGYVAVALLSITALPFGFFYIVLIGPHAVLRGALFGKSPVKKWRLAIAYPVIAAFGYGISVALYYLAGGLFGAGFANLVASIGGVFVLAVITTAIFMFYDFAVNFLSAELEKRIIKPKKATPSVPKQNGNADPFAESGTLKSLDGADSPSGIGEHSDADARESDNKEQSEETDSSGGGTDRRK